MTQALFDAVNAACLTAFAEDFTYHGLDGDVAMTGVFSETITREALGGQDYGDATHLLEVLKADITAAGIERRRDVSVRGIKYRILDLQTDMTGLTELTLRRYE